MGWKERTGGKNAGPELGTGLPHCRDSGKGTLSYQALIHTTEGERSSDSGSLEGDRNPERDLYLPGATQQGPIPGPKLPNVLCPQLSLPTHAPFSPGKV